MSRFVRTSAAAVLIVFLASSWVLVSAVVDPFERTRVRNSLLASEGSAPDFDWRPGAEPEGYLLEHGDAPDELRTVAESLRRESGDDDWVTALAIARHLSEGPGTGTGLMTDTVRAYRAIRSRPAGDPPRAGRGA